MSHSRKHLTISTLNDFPVPSNDEKICRVTKLLGNNNLEVQLPNGKTLVVTIPQKFNKVVWIGKGDFLITDLFQNYRTSDKSNGIVLHVLYKDQIKHLKSINIWPAEFPAFEEKPNHQVSHNQLGEFDITDSEEDFLGLNSNSDDKEDCIEKENNCFVNPNHTGVAAVVEDEDEWSC